jgi:gluconolactonase
VVELDPDGRPLRPAATEYRGQRLERPNDLTLDPAGGFYFTDPGNSSREPPAGSVYYVTPAGNVTRFATGLALPNGIALSADRKRLYVAESERNRILVWELAEPGRASAEYRVFADLPRPAEPGRAAMPDGIAFDEAGLLWVAHFGTGRVLAIDASGKLLASYEAGNRAVSNLCFGGPNFDRLYVTGGDPGALFRLDLGRPGLRLLPNRRPRTAR